MLLIFEGNVDEIFVENVISKLSVCGKVRTIGLRKGWKKLNFPLASCPIFLYNDRTNSIFQSLGNFF